MVPTTYFPTSLPLYLSLKPKAELPSQVVLGRVKPYHKSNFIPL